MDEAEATCPHCKQKLLKMANPEGTTWGSGYQLVCFNDECPYYVKGWEHMQKQFNAAVSYRFRFNPTTGEKGPIPVWSRLALRDLIIE